MTFYSDIKVCSYRTRTTNRIICFANHYDQYVNAIFVRSVDYSQITIQ